jgi:hypothetical protein
MKRLNDATPQEWDDAYDAVINLPKPGGIIFLETSDGSSANYYKLPPDANELQDLISYKNLNAQIGEIFRECYRYGQAIHSDEMRGIKKILFYAQAELKRLENLAKK